MVTSEKYKFPQNLPTLLNLSNLREMRKVTRERDVHSINLKLKTKRYELMSVCKLLTVTC